MNGPGSGDPGTAAAPGTAPPGAAGAPDPRRWFALVVILVAGFMDLLDVTIVNVVLPSVLTDLDAAYTHGEWIVAGYVLGFAALMITGGRLGDILGRRKVFLAGVAGFTAASLLCGLADGPGALIAARFLQGAMAGLMVPQILAIIHVTFPAEERGKVLGIWGGVLGAASAAGLVAGGLLAEADPYGLGWRAVFLVNVPVGAAALLAAWFLVPDSRAPERPRLDPLGALLSAAGILLLVHPLTEGRGLGWPPWTFLLMGAAVLVLGLFVLQQRGRTRRDNSPLMSLSLFRARAFSAGMAVWALFWIALGGFFFIWTLYMQVGLGWPPLRAGLTSSAFAVGCAAGSGTAVEFFTPRFGRKALLAGALLCGTGFLGYVLVAAHYGPAVAPWQMIAPLLVAGVGFGLVVAPMIDAVLTEVPVREAGSASGVLGTVQQIGIALGTALAGVLFFQQLDHDAARAVARAAPDLRQELTRAEVPAAERERILDAFADCLADRAAATDPTAEPASCRGPLPSPEVRALVIEAGQRATADNFSRTFALTLRWGAGSMGLVFLGLFALPRRVEFRGFDGGGPGAGAGPSVPGAPDGGALVSPVIDPVIDPACDPGEERSAPARSGGQDADAHPAG
ncbi:MFS transporter [Streptomyces physcomitrii]|uniref:MFS transporter n=1 Tax=Streptomyces physcomitrii TaxID=2724184 RepID=UPI0033DB5A8C